MVQHLAPHVTVKYKATVTQLSRFSWEVMIIKVGRFGDKDFDFPIDRWTCFTEKGANKSARKHIDKAVRALKRRIETRKVIE